MGGGRRSSASSSSSEDDGDADWRAAIDSVATTTTFGSSITNGVASSSSNGTAAISNSPAGPSLEDEAENHKPQHLKHYQLKAQKLLHEILEKHIEVVRDTDNISLEEPPENDVGGIRLFRHAPPGIVLDCADETQGPTKRPRILPGNEIKERSKKFRHQIQSVAVDAMDIIAAASDAGQKALAKLEARDAAAKAAAIKEEERVAELKRVRGERWLPSVSKYLQDRCSLLAEKLNKDIDFVACSRREDWLQIKFKKNAGEKCKTLQPSSSLGRSARFAPLFCYQSVGLQVMSE